MTLRETEIFRIKWNIIKKLYAKKAFRKGHLLFNTLKSGIPSHLAGFASEALSQLIKEELVVIYGTTKHGKAYQLNIKKLKEVEEIIFENK